MNLTDWRPPLENVFLCAVFVNEWESERRVSQAQIYQPQKGGQIHTRTHTHLHTHTYTGILFPDEVCLCCSQARREGEVELFDAAIRTTLSGQANKNEYFSPEISMGTYGGGLAHLQVHAHTHTDIHIHKDRYTAYHGCQNYSPPNHRCHNYHISITV